MTNFNFPINAVAQINESSYDGIILVWWPNGKFHPLQAVLDEALALDAELVNQVGVVRCDLPAGRVILASTGKIDADYDDVRRFQIAAKKGMARARKAGVRKPLLVVQQHEAIANAELLSLLGVLEELYVPIQLHEAIPKRKRTIDQLGVYACDGDRSKIERLIKVASDLEKGRIVARDIGGGDPERMAAPRVQAYVEALFSNTSIKVTVIDDIHKIESEYPLFHAVNRCANHVERHRGRVIFLEYNPVGGHVEKTLMLVGKGVTYDTGGADIKAGGVMAGMSRDKCGAAAVAGFMEIVQCTQPKHLKVIGAMCMVRNSVGSDCYVADEVITARSGARVRIGNTDAEGRMCMADILCQMKEMAGKEVNPHLYTIATLTGHACLAVGDGYSIVMDNGPARRHKHGLDLFHSSLQVGDPFEHSTIRREDIEFHRGKSIGDDVFQSNNLPSSRTPRGHQTPAGFLLLASGLIEHGSDSTLPLPYSHLDIAASSGDLPNEPTGAPIVALANEFIFKRNII